MKIQKLQIIQKYLINSNKELKNNFWANLFYHCFRLIFTVIFMQMMLPVKNISGIDSSLN